MIKYFISIKWKLEYIQNASPADSGNYTCAPANALQDSLILNVIKGKEGNKIKHIFVINFPGEKQAGLQEIANSAKQYYWWGIGSKTKDLRFSLFQHFTPSSSIIHSSSSDPVIQISTCLQWAVKINLWYELFKWS